MFTFWKFGKEVHVGDVFDFIDCFDEEEYFFVGRLIGDKEADHLFWNGCWDIDDFEECVWDDEIVFENGRTAGEYGTGNDYDRVIT